MAEKLVTLARYHDPLIARVASQKLEAAGIPSYISGENNVGLANLVNAGIPPVLLEVAEDDLPRAQQILGTKPEPGSGIQTEPDDVEPPEDYQSPDYLASRALRAAVFGCFVCPMLLHFYSVYLALDAYGRADEGLSDAARGNLKVALVIDAAVLGVPILGGLVMLLGGALSLFG